MGLALASALVVLIASGVALNRLGSDDTSRRHSQAAPPAVAPESAAEAGSTAPAAEVAAPAGTTAAAGGARPSTSAPVPPPAPATTGLRRVGGGSASPAAAVAGAPSATPEESGSVGSPMKGSADDGSPGQEAPPEPAGDPNTPALVAASASVGEGANGAVIGAGLGDNPDADVTVGTTHLVGDAPPSDGTAVGLGGRFFQPPPTVPVIPG